MAVQRLKVAILPLDLPCCGPVTHSGEILTTGKSHGKKSDRFFVGDNMIRVYTDGSKSEHGVGTVVVIFKDDKIMDTKKYKLDSRCSNNQAEQLAILKTLENIQNTDTNDKRVQIYTDSTGIPQKPEES